MVKRTLLYVGDAGCESGFAKNTHNILHRMVEDWNVAVLGINFRGDEHDFPWKMHPAYVPRGDLFGVSRLLWACQKYRPDVVVLQNDPWNIPAYMAELRRIRNPPPVMGIIAVDGLNCRGDMLNGMAHVVFWTDFARAEALAGGLKENSSVIPLGVDPTVYKPLEISRQQLRVEIGLPFDVVNGFIVGNINRNQPRKRLDLTIRYFAKWVQEYKVDDAFLYLHVAPTGDQGYDCQQLAKYYGVNERLVLAEPEMYHGTPEALVAKTLNCFDVQLSTTQGEGWGLTTLEGMACGIPQVVPRWSALGEWCEDAAMLINCPTTCVTPIANAIGGIPDEGETISALDNLYRSVELRNQYGIAGYDLSCRDKFRWSLIAEQYHKTIGSVWSRRARIVV